jgi:hypothetical protein
MRVTRDVLFLLGGAGIIVLWTAFSRPRANQSAVAAIGDADRHLLYERTLENLKFCKTGHAGRLQEFCGQQAEFIVAFPECDEACRELSNHFASRPTR